MPLGKRPKIERERGEIVRGRQVVDKRGIALGKGCTVQVRGICGPGIAGQSFDAEIPEPHSIITVIDQQDTARRASPNWVIPPYSSFPAMGEPYRSCNRPWGRIFRSRNRAIRDNGYRLRN
jgi:hypothetical protein